MADRNKWTGERLETFITNETMLEHLHRYAITFNFIKEKKILDIACGEGYGCFLMSKTASHVTGIDINDETINKAKEKYNTNNIEFRQGDILQIPFADQSFDIITCFETLEHVEEHDIVLSELKRVLKRSGLLFISTPEKSNYRDKRRYNNPFHKKELYIHEFKELLNQQFKFASFHSQSALIGSVISSENKQPVEEIFVGDFNNIQTEKSLPVMYWVGLASNTILPVLNTSIFQISKSLSELQEEETALLKKTITYRTGNIILSPFKFIRSLFRK